MICNWNENVLQSFYYNSDMVLNDHILQLKKIKYTIRSHSAVKPHVHSYLIQAQVFFLWLYVNLVRM